MAETETAKTEAAKAEAAKAEAAKKAERQDDKRGSKAADDMTPVPTQAELDEFKGGEAGKKEKAEREKAAASRKPEDLTPFPSQAENDEIKCKVFGTTVADQKKLNEEYLKEHGEEPKKGKAAADEMKPTPTQDELDEYKTEAMYEPPGSGDPQTAKRKTIEAGKTEGGYTTRTVQPEHAPRAKE